ncbi:MAG: hypothetical protein IKL23_00310 [Oscillospiraceae bacterium]|nr:hypothetical protein [Oscillospiraceae bacterium]
MSLFEKKELVFQTVGGSERWKAARKALKNADIRAMEAACYEREMPTCGCGAKVNQEFLSPYGKLDRRVYYVSVRAEDAERAKVVLLAAVGTPLISDEQVYPEPKKISKVRQSVEDFLNRRFP